MIRGIKTAEPSDTLGRVNRYNITSDATATWRVIEHYFIRLSIVGNKAGFVVTIVRKRTDLNFRPGI